MTLRIEEAMRFMQRQERNKFTCMMFMYYLRAKARHTLAEIEADHIKKLQYINESIRDLKDQVLGVYTFNIGEVYHNLARLYTLKAEVHAQRNELAEEKSSWDRAVLYYNEAKNRGDIVVASLGEALVKAKQFPRAKAFIASALKTYPDNSSLNHLYSTALLGLGNYLEAYKYHNKSLQQCAEHDQSIYIEFFSKVLQQTHPEETYGVFTSRMKRESRSFCTKLCSSRGRQAQNAEGSSNLKSNTSGGDYKLVAGISL